MRRIGLFAGIVAGALVLASPALAGWGEDWGTMVWGAAPVGVPTLGLLGFGLLSLVLAAGAVFSLRRRSWAMSVLLVALAIPLAAVASPITGLNVFSNGSTADANEVNANFDAVETAVNDNDSRITAVDNDAAAAQSAADTAAGAVTDEVTARSAADVLLQAAIDDEATTRATAFMALQGSISAEGTARSSADLALDGRVTTIEAGVLPITIDGSGVSVADDLVVTGNFTSSGSGGGIITARRGAGTIVIDPTDVTSGYTAKLSVDDQGIKLGHNSSVRDIQFQTEGTTRMTVSAGGNLVVQGEIFSNGLNLTSAVIELFGGGPCGVLYPVPADACPFGNSAESLSIYRNLPSCDQAPPLSYCDADGECGTNNDLDNCGPCVGEPTCLDIYYRVH